MPSPHLHVKPPPQRLGSRPDQIHGRIHDCCVHRGVAAVLAGARCADRSHWPPSELHSKQATGQRAASFTPLHIDDTARAEGCSVTFAPSSNRSIYMEVVFTLGSSVFPWSGVSPY